MAELRVKGTGTIKLFENDNTSSVTIASPASLSANKTVTLPDADVTLASGTMLATDGSGASLTALNASELGSGTVPTARLGSGTASSATILYGDQTYKAEPGGGKVLQVVTAVHATVESTTANTFQDSSLLAAITPASTSNKVFISCSLPVKAYKNQAYSSVMIEGMYCGLFVTNVSGTKLMSGELSMTNSAANSDIGSSGSGWAVFNYLHAPSSTSEVTYRIGFRADDSDAATLFTAYLFAGVRSDDVPGAITLMEIDGT